MKYLIQFGISFTVFMAIDLLWLGIVARPLYAKFLGHLLNPHPIWPVAWAFYILFVIGLIVFAISPAIDLQSVRYAAFYGALFGFFTYMTYDLTNWATLKAWPAGIVPIDILWGTCLSALVCSISTWIYLRFFGA